MPNPILLSLLPSPPCPGPPKRCRALPDGRAIPHVPDEVPAWREAGPQSKGLSCALPPGRGRPAPGSPAGCGRGPGPRAGPGGRTAAGPVRGPGPRPPSQARPLRVRPSWTSLRSRPWWSARAATWARWVTARTWWRRPSSPTRRPTAMAVSPPMPASTSSSTRTSGSRPCAQDHPCAHQGQHEAAQFAAGGDLGQGAEALADVGLDPDRQGGEALGGDLARGGRSAGTGLPGSSARASRSWRRAPPMPRRPRRWCTSFSSRGIAAARRPWRASAAAR